MATLLCMDPNPVMLELHKAVLDSGGYRVLAASESTGLALARNSSFDAALLDFNIPGLDANSVVEILMKEHPAVPVVMLSGHPDAVPESLRWLADAVLEAANRADVLLATMARLIGKVAGQRRIRTRVRSLAKIASCLAAAVLRL